MPTNEAKLEANDRGGKGPADPGWFIVNVRDAVWRHSERFGDFTAFESPDHRFADMGVNIHVLKPGQPACMYHRESIQEGFLVLDGQCTLIVEEQERPMKAWDYFHCPAETTHVFVGGGDGPCTILMMGARRDGVKIHYPKSEVAAGHGASVETPTDEPREAYAGIARPEPCDPRWPKA